MGGVTAIWDKVKPFLSRTWSGDGATPETDVKTPETVTAEASVADFKTWYNNKFSQHPNDSEWTTINPTVSTTDKSLITMKVGSTDIKYKKLQDGSYVQQ